MGKSKTEVQFKKEIYDLVGDEYTVLGEYKGTLKKIKMRHNSKDCIYYKEKGEYYEYEVTPNKFLSLGRRCPACNKKKKKSLQEYINEVYSVVGNEYTVLGNEYVNRTTPIKMRHNCELCNYHEWYPTPDNFINTKTRCPECAKKNKSSKAENEIIDYIKLIYDKEILLDERKALDGKELDIYLPDIKLAIEYNGFYWHCKEYKDLNYHLNKYNLCKEKGITLITIWEDDYEKDKEKYHNIIKSFIDDDPVYDVIYKENLVYINKDYEDLEDTIYDDELDKYYEYIGDKLPELINRQNYGCWNIGYKIYKEIKEVNIND